MTRTPTFNLEARAFGLEISAQKHRNIWRRRYWLPRNRSKACLKSSNPTRSSSWMAASSRLPGGFRDQFGDADDFAVIEGDEGEVGFIAKEAVFGAVMQA